MSQELLASLVTIASGLDHPEAIAVSPDGSSLWCGGEAGQIYRIDLADGRLSEVANTAGFLLGVALDADGNVYACNLGETSSIVRVDPASGEVAPYCATADGGPLAVPNWAAFATDGALWFTDSGTESLDVRDGRLIRVSPGGGDGEVVSRSALHFPNGMCVSANDEIFVLETLTPRLSRLVGRDLETIVELPGHSPDGLALCADGGFIVSCYYPFRILYVPPEGGRFETLIDDVTGIHLPMPTNTAFYGPGLRSLAIASLGGQVIKSVDLGIAGARLNYPRIS